MPLLTSPPAKLSQVVLSSFILVILINISTFLLPSLLFGPGETLVTTPSQTLMLVAMIHLPISIMIFSPSLQQHPISSLGWAAIAMVTATPIIHITCVLFGAPFLTHFQSTLSFSATIAVMAAIPGVCLKEGDLTAIHRLYFGLKIQSSTEILALASTIGCLFGAWLGAFAIPLDWDRPWQPWPISSAYGAIACYSLGVTMATIYLISSGTSLSPIKKPKTW